MFSLIIFLTTTVCVGGKSLTEVTLQNVDSVISGESFVLLLSYVPWDSQCKKLVSELEELSELFADRNDIVLAKVNNYEEVKLSTRLWLSDFPEFRYFLIGSTTPETYTGKMSKGVLLEFIQSKSKLFFNKEIFRNAILPLDRTNFERIVKDRERNVLVYFHTDWCPLCKTLDTAFERVGYTFRNEPHCVLAKVNGDESYEISVQYEIPHYPTLKFFSKHNKDGIIYPPGRLNENYSEQNMTRFLNFACKTDRKPSGTLGEKVGRIEEFDQIAERFMNQWRQRDEILQEALGKVKDQRAEERPLAQYYILVMRKILLDGASFIREEIARLDRMRTDHLHPDKSDEFDKRRNILRQFSIAHMERDEL